jgi:site-specific DNA recombinase
MPQQCIAYLRVSGRGQVNGHGYDRQEETIRLFAKHNGYYVLDVYRDAHTGTESDRPAFVEMLASLGETGARTVIIESLDRLARDLMVQTRLLSDLVSRGITLISASTGEDVTAAVQQDPMRGAMVQVQGVFAELDKKLLVRKLRKSREAKRALTGRCEGRKPFGARPGEAEILERIFELRRGRGSRPRLSFAKIAALLNAEGVPTRGGGAWLPGTVYALVRAHRPNLTRPRPRKVVAEQ